MRYFVIHPDGQSYGPAELGLLAQWAGQGRLAPETLVVEESTGRQLAARELPGLSFPPAGPIAPAAPPFPGYFPAAGPATPSPLVTWSWILVVVGGIFPCFGTFGCVLGLLLSGAAIWLAVRAAASGARTGCLLLAAALNVLGIAALMVYGDSLLHSLAGGGL